MQKYFFSIIAGCSFLVSAAQVQVRDEPRHHNVFENEFVRVLDVYIAPKDTTQYHLHNTPSIFIILSNSNVGSRLKDGQPQKGANINGDISYDSLSKPRIHRVWNEDTSWFHVMDIELTNQRTKLKIPPFQNPSFKLLFNEEQLNGYELDLKTSSMLQLPASSNGYLLISKKETVIDYKINEVMQHRIMKAGHYIWVEAGRNSSISAGSQSPAAFVLLQLK